MSKEFQEILSKTLIVIPTYNNETTLTQLIEDVLKQTPHVLVVNDGATDSTKDILLSFSTKIVALENEKNKGKGYSIKRGFDYALSHGFEYVITLDSDGQHFAEDIPLFINDIIKNGDALIVGARDMESANVPGKSSFGYRFSNFWYWAETGEKLEDTQSGYRLYPVKRMRKIHFYTNRFEFEVEVLIRSQWRGISVKTIPVQIFYAEEGKRISHFKPSIDFTRISILNTVLFTIALLWIHPRNLFIYLRDTNFLDVLKKLFTENNASPAKVSNALGFGIFMGIVPIWGFQMLTATFLAHKMKLNKALVLLASNISIPPVVPFLIYFGYQTGFFLWNQHFDTFENIQNVTKQLMNNGLIDSIDVMWQGLLFYFVGSFIFAALAGISMWLISHLVFFIKNKIA
jgi:glycosyltransferase involved in cell wall biosynthesis